MTFKPDDFLITPIAHRSIPDELIEGEHGLDIRLERNVQTDHEGEIEAAYDSIMLTRHGGSGPNAMLLLSPQKIPAFKAALTELYDEWRREVQRSKRAGITVEDVFREAQARGVPASDMLAEVLEQTSLDDGKVSANQAADDSPCANEEEVSRWASR